MTVTWTDDGIGRVLDARYRLVAAIGAGASARVYLADDLRLRRQVAVKILHPALALDQVFLRRFEQEARSAAAFNHPHVVAVHDWGDTEVGPYLVTEYLAGGSLQALLASGARLSASQAVKVGLEAASGLAAAHRRGMVHRDIKPANLLFGSGSRLRVADFGLVHALSEAALTEPEGVVLGTVRYSGPERAEPGLTDGRTDVYSLVLTLVEAVTGIVPLSTGDHIEVISLRGQQSVEVPDVFGAAQPILARGGLVALEQRPSAEELMHELVYSTEYFDAPERLPLAGAIRTGTPAPTFDDPIVVGDAPTELLDGEASSEPLDMAESRPARGRHPVAWMLALFVLLGGGAVAAGFMVSSVEPPQVATYQLANLRGMSIDDVRVLSESNEWTLDEDQVRSDTLETDTVVWQSPGAGSELPAGETIFVQVVVGPLQSLAPWLVGLDIDDAMLRLETRGFEVGARDPRFDEVVPAGEVINALVEGSAVRGGVLLEPGTEFDLVVSQGPVPRTVPDLVGIAVADALARVGAVGLGLVEEPDRVFSEDVPVDFVISQNTPAADQVARGTTVTVLVSKGQDRRVVPDVAGMTIDAATASLESVGLFRLGVSGGGDVVENTDPRAGTLLRPGDGVLLFAPR